MISIIAAISKNRVIGKDNALPWHLPADLKHFKEITKGRPVIMGRKTFESIGRPLPNRKNIVITRQKDYSPVGCFTARSIDEALELVQGEPEIFFIGGSQIFSQILPKTSKIYLTLIDHEFKGDAYFPELNSDEWVEVERQEGVLDDKNQYRHTFLVFERKRGLLIYNESRNENIKISV